ncbi:MAG TPA: TetR/AcrR family transcriptional regulator [Verrucomicrobiae bacterium]|nr:TetR/AcrR family transcriptional regulator [Verrucomicrobiae bacterium]
MNRPTPKIKTKIRRTQITRAALVLIARRGLNHLNIGALAGEVGVVPSAIYRHFQGMDDVLESVLELISQSLLANVEAVRQETPDALEQLHRLLQRHLQLVRHHAGIPRVIFSEQVFAGNVGRKRRMHRIMQTYLRKVAEIVRGGQHVGRIRKEATPDTVAVMFLGLIQPAVILWLMSNGGFDVVRHAEQAWRLFCGILQNDGNAGDDAILNQTNITTKKEDDYATERKLN